MENRAERRRPIRTTPPIPIELEGYEGWWVTIRTNVPMQVIAQLDAGVLSETYLALSQLCRDSNFVDDDGAPIDVTKPEEWPRVDIHLLVEVCRAAREAINDPLASGRKIASLPTSTATPTA